MNTRCAFAFLLAFAVVPLSALAQTEEAPTPQSNAWTSLLMTLLPIFLIGGFVWWLLKKVMKKQQKRSEDYIANQLQHNQRTEALLERIADALEKNASGPK
jgi:flagellar biogenesis protein FliO